jgi:hypothetical protein
VRDIIDVLVSMEVDKHVPMLMLNADLLAGPMGPPGVLAPSVVAGDVFLSECCRLPESVLSLGWQVTDYSLWTRKYRENLVKKMAELLERPMIARAKQDPSTGAELCPLEYELVAVKDVARHISFALFAPFVMRSKESVFQNLLNRFANSSLCLYTGTGGMGISEATRDRITSEFDDDRLFLDVQIRSWVELCCCGLWFQSRAKDKGKGPVVSDPGGRKAMVEVEATDDDEETRLLSAPLAQPDEVDSDAGLAAPAVPGFGVRHVEIELADL